MDANLTIDFIKYHKLDEGPIKSIDQFYTEGIPRCLNSLVVHTKTGDVKVVNPVILKPQIDNKDLYPYEAKCRQLSYSGNLIVTLLFYPKKEDGSISTKHTLECQKCIGNVPIMVKSSKCHLNNLTEDELIKHNECPYMIGGYFIYKGGLKSIISQENLATNQVFKFQSKKGGMKTEMRFIRKDFSRTHVTVKYNPKTKIFYIVLPFLKGGKQPDMDETGTTKKESSSKNNISLGIFFKYFGVSMKNMINLIKNWHPSNVSSNMGACSLNDINNFLEQTVEESYLCDDPEEEFIKRLNIPNATHSEKIEKIKTSLNREFFDGLAYINRNLNMVAMMTCRLIQAMKGDPFDDRDSYINKRSDMAGEIMLELFRTLSMDMFKNTQISVDKSNNINHFDVVVKSMNPQDITNGFGFAFASGNFGKSGFASKDGVSQVLLYNSLPCMISQIRRRNKPLDKNGKLVGPRQLHNTQWGIICPSETPEGEACGLTNNSSIVELISLYRDLSAIPILLKEYISNESDENHSYALMINGNWEGWVSENIINIVRKWRLKGDIPYDVSIGSTFYNEIRINGDSGRSIRPCLIVKNGKCLLKEKLGTLNLESKGWTWADVIKNELVEYLDKFEEEKCNVAISPYNIENFHTHCDIDLSAILGYCANLIPFPQHNPGPRLSYECSMLKQAISKPKLNEKFTFETSSKVLDYTQKYIVETDIAKVSNLDSLGMGQTPIVAVLAGAYNQEDSIIVNQASIDRGLFRTTVYKTTKEVQKTSERELFCNPSNIVYTGENSKKKKKNYQNIDDDGSPVVGCIINPGDILIGKIKYVDDKPIDCSIIHRNTDKGIVDTVLITQDGDSNLIMIIKMRYYRIPKMGDKFAQRHAQKGVIGLIVSESDMPFVCAGPSAGMRPDILINPHMMPSRMTIGYIYELLLGKQGCIRGMRHDGTAFRPPDMDSISEDLKSLGYSPYGKEIMCDGKRGNMYKCAIYMGPVGYQTLKHQVDDKMHARAKGPVQRLTRQPVEGRSRNGGLRLGGMEVDSIGAHGSTAFLQERMMKVSDQYDVPICSECGFIPIKNKEFTKCNVCSKKGKTTEIGMLTMPYPLKLLHQELMSCSIGMTFNVEKNDFTNKYQIVDIDINN